MTRKSTPKPPIDYEVGYGKPPTQTRFRKGVSGNPFGRRTNPSPKGRDHEPKVLITVEGRCRRVPLTEALRLQLGQKALAGDMQAIREYQRMIEQLTRAKAVAVAPELPVTIFRVDGLDSPNLREALFVLGIVEGTAKRFQRLAQWVVEAALARRQHPLSECDTETVRRALGGRPA